MFDREIIKYARFTIVQATILKEDLEILEINKLDNTLFLLDIEVMYPSIKYKLVEKAVHYLAKKMKLIDKKKTQLCLNWIQFGMNSTLMVFEETYYKYGEIREI